ncbi:hypothetical protein [Lewinella sp. IMCC34191]|uniref:hypothetical protein n=1 Tax=Lewinella sp. IMCC34191 TaxID=2259172 RepID=UPI00130074FA|nr:hypothetical protein [Lewinella sp. IMCC34191]
MKISVFSLLLVALVRSAGCNTDTESPAETTVSDCGALIQVRDPMPRLTSDDYQVVNAEVDGLCLSVTISATGCSSQAWRVALHTSGAVAESSPTQTDALLVFDDGVGENEMTCQAIMEETYQFDLSPYLADALPTVFTLTGTETSVAIPAG